MLPSLTIGYYCKITEILLTQHKPNKNKTKQKHVVVLMLQNVLELWYRGVVLSLQEAYALLLGNHVSQEMYQVYCHLRRIGYVVIRHQGR